MANPINTVTLPPEVQRTFPAGVLLYSFDGEVQYSRKNPNHEHEYRVFSLAPIVENASMYERRWQGNREQTTFLPIENFHGHPVTLYYVYVPDKNTARTGQYNPEIIAAWSWHSQQWMWVTNPNALEEVFEGPIQGRMGKEFAKQLFKWGGKDDRRRTNDGYAMIVDQIVTHLRYDMSQKLQRANQGTGRL